MKTLPRRPRTVGLDKPCRVCGKPIHYTYSGPVEGICGRCADKRPRRRVRPYHRGMTVGGTAPMRRSTASTVVRLTIVMLVCVAAGLSALILLLG